MNLEKYKNISLVQTRTYVGYVTRVLGFTIESIGPIVNVGDLCSIETKKGEILAEVVGFNGKNVSLMPLGNADGIGVGARVKSYGNELQIKVGSDLLGKVVDWQAIPLDKEKLHLTNEISIDNTSPNPLTRKRISSQLELGIKAIDGMLSIGEGQRIGIFAGSGVGKSTLLGMMARNASSDINVIALIGERGREVREFLEKDLKKEGLEKSIVVVATSDQPALMRLKAAMTATAIAEYFREQGKSVLLMMDSLTRFAMAQREIGLSIGEPPVSKGYTPSVFGVLPKLLERAGNSDKGSITGLYTVLVDGDDLNEPITDTVRGILDGHIILSRKIANKGQYPAIDILASISRVMGDIVSEEHMKSARILKKHLAIYNESEDLISVGAYNKGSNPEIDLAIEKIGEIKKFISQETGEKFSLKDTIEILSNIAKE